MTDKVQKIKNWISKEQDGLMDAQGNFEYPEHEGAYHILCNLDTYIDSLQEEPKFKTGDRIKPIDSCLGSSRIIEEVCDSWYVTDQGTLDFEYEDNWELAEEPVSEDLEKIVEEIAEPTILNAYGTKELARRLRNTICGTSVSEDLEEEINHYIKRNGYDGLDSIEEVKYIANHFANWQKQQMESNRIKHCNTITEEQYNLETGFIDKYIEKYNRMPTFLDAIEYGIENMKQQIIKAIDLGEPPHLISVEQAYYNVKKLLKC